MQSSLAKSVNLAREDIEESADEKTLLSRFVALFPYPKFILQLDSPLRRRFNIIVFIFALWNAFIVPLRLAFYGQQALDHWAFYFFDYLSDLVFIIDIILNFRTTVIFLTH